MITKGTEAYTAAQKLANELVEWANTSKRANASYFEIAIDKVCKFVNKIETIGGFAAEIAKTVNKSIDPFGYQAARISSKQAWILACAAIENNVKF